MMRGFRRLGDRSNGRAGGRALGRDAGRAVSRRGLVLETAGDAVRSSGRASRSPLEMFHAVNRRRFIAGTAGGLLATLPTRSLWPIQAAALGRGPGMLGPHWVP